MNIELSDKKLNIELNNQRVKEKVKSIQVAVGVIENQQGQVLTALRPEHVDQGGLWEFPGGKLEEGEGALCALKRELQEEVGICVEHAEPLIEVRHDYPNIRVCLSTFRVLKYSGEPIGAEGQNIQWQDKSALFSLEMPKASLPIIKALCLPECYCITPLHLSDEVLLSHVKTQLDKRVKLIQLRGDYSEAVTIKLHNLCLEYHARLLVKDLLLAKRLEVGVHLRASELMDCDLSMLADINFAAASCHNLAELKKAEALDLDFAVLSPVLPTPSHGGVENLGWPQFENLVKNVNFPVYALGGMEWHYIDQVKRLGGQGLAGIRLFC
ncbi:8-oxo-dGTP diphosphatase [Piscirickettsia salmonis]|uniref:Nudix family hydrolase n=1 Tax=Piscirickettsia salmonis TaxID=1238 RepID=UPI0012B86001|nr:Nudix family hydrolase [Piscirickettsia salmonis]QGP51826.1 8-oxo-dGTP diphosphatase [Piscirickettsia salmonis]QGP52935.1 8-oxo-dGTP diphosphatase [Piscirickettsia salmonis]QGP61135.1 8-oxo-dGTP diphosphatase [Piscirickettsia salmonis]QGP62507.1 8-oxo-dGTP diphosphatase [Piscirickettsia salmonis]